jgi:hypothetical protein
MKALEKQIGGNHYKKMAMQPMEFSLLMELNAPKHTVVKYVSRFESKGGVDDLRKAAHCIELLREYWEEKEVTDDRDFNDIVAAMRYCRANSLSALQTDCIVMTVMANDFYDLSNALEACHELIRAVESRDQNDIHEQDLGNWPASADERMDIIGTNGNEGEHYDDDMSNHKNWRVGDLLECIKNGHYFFAAGDVCEVSGYGSGESWTGVTVRVRGTTAEFFFDSRYPLEQYFKFHSRPTKEQR